MGFGLKPGLLATVASVAPANYFWMLPEHAFGIDRFKLVQILAFLIAGGSVSWLGEVIRRQKWLKENLWATLASAGDAIVSTDCHGRIVYLNAMAQILTELRYEDALRRAIGGVLFLLTENDQLSISTTFQAALNNDEIEKLPQRLIIVSKSGRQHRVEQKTSRILDAQGRKLGAMILFHV